MTFLIWNLHSFFRVQQYGLDVVERRRAVRVHAFGVFFVEIFENERRVVGIQIVKQADHDVAVATDFWFQLSIAVLACRKKVVSADT